MTRGKKPVAATPIEFAYVQSVEVPNAAPEIFDDPKINKRSLRDTYGQTLMQATKA